MAVSVSVIPCRAYADQQTLISTEPIVTESEAFDDFMAILEVIGSTVCIDSRKYITGELGIAPGHR